MAGSLPVQAQLQRWGTVSKAQQRGLSERQGAVVDDLLVADNSAGQDSTKSSGQAKSAQPKEHKDPAVILTEALLPQPHKYWHPPIVHFPIAFFVLEALLLAVFLFKPTQFAENASRWLLWLALISVPAVGITGVHDAGVDLGGTNAILDGISDRIHNFTHFDDALSVHVLFIDVFLLLSICRLAWRLYLDKSRNFVSQKIGFSIVTFIGLWILLAAAQAGGSMSHQ
jgi:uncharacterized membrane protein